MTSPVHVGRALESLRDSNFNTVSAIGEVIDNAIQAEAKNIKIKIKKEKIRQSNDLIEIGFSDDGAGMDVETLGRCLQLGFSKRYNNRDGIGRFGVGMTLAAITQCTRIEVYSKPKGGGWNFTYLDLNEMKEQEDAVIPTPRPVEVPREYSEILEDFGTLVIWKNWDREDTTIDKMKIWIGRTYRKFIGEEIIQDDKVIPNPDQKSIFIDDGENNERISALDPLYATKTDYNSETADLAKPITLEVDIHKFERLKKISKEPQKITIRFALSPKSWRLKQGTGLSADNKSRHIPDNEGVSILRNNREVFYGHLPYFKMKDQKSSHYTGFIDLDRFWGCEIAFNAELDQWFSVKNVKTGARPTGELKDKLYQIIIPTIAEFREAIRDTWKKETNKIKKDSNGALSGTTDAEGIIKGDTSQTPPSKDEMDDLMRGAGNIKDKAREELEIRIANNPITFIKDFEMDKRSNFIDVAHRGGSTLIHLNMQHSFFDKFFHAFDELNQKISNCPEFASENLLKYLETNLYLLLGSFVQTHNDFGKERTQTAEDFIDKLIHDWGYYLNKNTGLPAEQ